MSSSNNVLLVFSLQYGNINWFCLFSWISHIISHKFLQFSQSINEFFTNQPSSISITACGLSKIDSNTNLSNQLIFVCLNEIFNLSLCVPLNEPFWNELPVKLRLLKIIFNGAPYFSFNLNASFLISWIDVW